MADRRAPVQFLPNTPVRITFDFDGGKEFTDPWGNLKTAYSVNGTEVVFADQHLAAKLNFCEPTRGATVYVTKRVVWTGGKKRKPHSEWQVSASEPGTIQRRNEYPATAVQDMGIEESQLERELRESHEIRQKAQARSQARENVARQTVQQARENIARMPMPEEEPPHPADMPQPRPPAQQAIARKQPQVEAHAQSQTQLEAALRTVLYACKTATAYAREIEYQAPPFTSDDIARMAMTLVIGKEQRR